MAGMMEATLPFSWKGVAAGLLVLGLLLTAVGAGIAASGVILTERYATELASTKWGMNVELRDALLDQSAKAKWGLIIIVIGTVMQLVGTIMDHAMTGNERRLQAEPGSYAVTGTDVRLTHSVISQALKLNWYWVALYAFVTIGGIVLSYWTTGLINVLLATFVAVVTLVVGYLMLQKVITITKETR